jgi:hypothetical protein
MKKLILIMISLILITITGTAQEMKYLFQGKDKNVSVSGFAGVINEFSGFDGDFAFSMGGGAAMLIDQRFFLGAYGQGVTTRHLRDYSWYEPYLEENVDYYDVYTRFGHGGFWLGYIHKPHKAVNFGLNARLGWGAISLTDKTYKDYNDSWNNLMYDAVFVITPEFDLNLNLLKWMRVSMGVGYRFVTGVDQTYMYDDPDQGMIEKEYFDKNAFNSVTGNITLAFGWFAN